MSISMYSASVPVYQRVLRGLDAILDKAEAWAGERRLLGARNARSVLVLPTSSWCSVRTGGTS